MPAVIVNHDSKKERLSDQKFTPAKSFKWTASLRNTFKELVNLQLQNFRIDVDAQRRADEAELKCSVEEYVKRFLKGLVPLWPTGGLVVCER